ELEIAVVAEGIERIEEWCWLESAGIKRFQGFLFAMPKVNGVGDIRWSGEKVKPDLP
ncbi:TPA: EAL domain-containing protein, partial [Klebsiella michiganensis]